MRYETGAPSIKALIAQTKAYVTTNIELLKLKFIDKASSATSSIISFIAIALIMFITIILLIVGVALWLGRLLGAYHYGFFITGGLLIIVIILLYKFKDRLLKKPVANSLIEKMFK